jgi:hypothetical protein
MASDRIGLKRPARADRPTTPTEISAPDRLLGVRILRRVRGKSSSAGTGGGKTTGGGTNEVSDSSAWSLDAGCADRTGSSGTSSRRIRINPDSVGSISPRFSPGSVMPGVRKGIEESTQTRRCRSQNPSQLCSAGMAVPCGRAEQEAPN